MQDRSDMLYSPTLNESMEYFGVAVVSISILVVVFYLASQDL